MVFVTEGWYEGLRACGGSVYAVTSAGILDGVNTVEFIRKLRERHPNLKCTDPSY